MTFIEEIKINHELSRVFEKAALKELREATQDNVDELKLEWKLSFAHLQYTLSQLGILEGKQ
jgi:hypothetical protein